MNKGIAHHLMLALIGLPGISLYGGLVSTQEQIQPLRDEATGVSRNVMLRYPVTDDFQPCAVERPDLKSFVPSATETGILYFESSGTAAKGRNGRFFSYESRLRLVIWLNTERIAAAPAACPSPQDSSPHDLPTLLLNEVIKRFDTLRNTNVANYVRLRVDVSQVLDSNYNLFAAYSFDKATTQYLMPPYQALGIDMVVSYDLHQNCIQNLVITAPESC